MDYKSLVADAERLMQTASFRQAYAAISAGLSQRSRLDECTLQTFACAVGRAHTKPTMEQDFPHGVEDGTRTRVVDTRR